MRTLLVLFSTVLSTLGSNAQWTTMQMELGRVQIAGVGNFDRVMLIGGFDGNYNDCYTILDYHRGDGSYHEDLELSVARYKLASAISGDKLLTAGGVTLINPSMSDMVEIYDLSNNSLIAEAQLSEARMELSAVTVGDKVLFAGGLLATDMGTKFVLSGSSDVVDIYDVPSDTWTVEHLSQARGGMACAVLDGKAYFAGGYQGNNVASDRVDIYDAVTGIWSTGTLSQARAFFGGGAAVGGKVMFAGGTQAGINNSDRVDIYDPVSDTWDTRTLSLARCGIQAAVTGDYALFAGGGDNDMPNWSFMSASDRVDIYNSATDEWSTASMSSARVNFAAAGSGSQVFLFGGVDNSFSNNPTVVDIFTDASTIGINEPTGGGELSMWPNPFTDKLHIASLDALAGCRVEVYDAKGVRVGSFKLRNTLEMDLSDLYDGLYQVRVVLDKNGRVLTSKPVIKG